MDVCDNEIQNCIVVFETTDGLHHKGVNSILKCNWIFAEVLNLKD